MPNTARKKKLAMLPKQAKKKEEEEEEEMCFGLFDDEPEGLSVFYCTFVVEHAMYDSELGNFMLWIINALS